MVLLVMLDWPTRTDAERDAVALGVQALMRLEPPPTQLSEPMTKRDLFESSALNGLLANPDCSRESPTAEELVDDARHYARVAMERPRQRAQ